MNSGTMKRMLSISTTVKIVFIPMLLLALCTIAEAIDPPFTVKPDLFDQANTDHLGLNTEEGTETFTVFEPSDATDKFSNGVVLIGFKDWL